jgi:ankyrin repeat protein
VHDIKCALPALHQAALRGDLASLAAHHARGANLNARFDPFPQYGLLWHGVTPLMLAAHSTEGADVATLRWLLAHGADLRATSTGGVTAAWFAVWHGEDWVCSGDRTRHHERLAFLLDAGLDAGERLPDGHTLVSEAVWRGDVESLRVLIARGAPVDPTWSTSDSEHQRQSARDHFRRYGGSSDPEYVDRMIEGIAKRIGDAPPPHVIPLHAAAEVGSLASVRLLLESGASPQRLDDQGCTALVHAASAEIVHALVAAGADPGSLGPERYGGALSRQDVLDHVLSDENPYRKRLEVAEALLAHGASLERAPSAETTRLYDAAFRRDADVVAWLLARGLRPGPDSYDERSPLHAVCWQGEMEVAEINAAGARIIRLLVEAGNSPTARDEKGLSPMDEAVDGDWASATAVQTLLELGALPDEPGPGRVTPLMGAADSGSLGCLRLLLAAGADPRRPDADGATAVDHARSLREIRVQLRSEATPDAIERTTKHLAEAEEALALLEAAAAR